MVYLLLILMGIAYALSNVFLKDLARAGIPTLFSIVIIHATMLACSCVVLLIAWQLGLIHMPAQPPVHWWRYAMIAGGFWCAGSILALGAYGLGASVVTVQTFVAALPVFGLPVVYFWDQGTLPNRYEWIGLAFVVTGLCIFIFSPKLPPSS